jgi:protease I
MQLPGMKILVLISQDFEDLEFWVPAMRLQEEGAQIIVAGLHANEALTGKHGVPAKTDISFETVQTKDFDALLIPGGWAPDKLRRYEHVKRIVKEMDQRGKVVGMICHAGLVGISAGIVKGHDATGSEGIKDDLINAGANWVNQPALRSGNQVWGRVVPDIPDYCRELVQALVETKASH